MKKYIFIFLLAALTFSCGEENKKESEIAKVPLPKVDLERFDRAFFEAGPENLPELKQKYPEFFPAEYTDQMAIADMKDPFMNLLKDKSQEKFQSLDYLKDDVTQMLQHIKYYYPQLPVPGKLATVIYADTDIKSVYTNQVILVPLSLYLGKDNEVYQEHFPDYKLVEFEPSQILPDLVTSFSEDKIAPPKDRTLLSLMIYYGKQLYMKDLLIPETPDHDKICYTKEQLEWARVNEFEIWSYFVDRELLFESDSKLPARFINPAPFSKFYLELDNESPGRIGQWLGWQIVRSYAENNKDVPLQQLMAMDAKEIFDNSKYKPKK